jgi:hypothetical protein
VAFLDDERLPVLRRHGAFHTAPPPLRKGGDCGWWCTPTTRSTTPDSGAGQHALREEAVNLLVFYSRFSLVSSSLLFSPPCEHEVLAKMGYNSFVPPHKGFFLIPCVQGVYPDDSPLPSDLDVTVPGFSWDCVTRTGSRSMVIWESKDLINWSAPNLTLSGPPSPNQLKILTHLKSRRGHSWLLRPVPAD